MSDTHLLVIDARHPLLPNPLRWPQLPSKFAALFIERLVLTIIIPGTTQNNPLFWDTSCLGPLPLSLQILAKARHVIAPFDLRRDPAALSRPENRDMLMRIFPGTTGVGSDGTFLYIYVSVTPAKPWPKTIAGLALYLAPRPGPEHCPMPSGRPVSRRNDTIADEMDGRDMKTWTPLFETIRDHFISLGISITQVMYWGNLLIIVLEHRDTDVAKLPRKAAGVPCHYLYGDEMGRPRLPQAQRQSDPTPGNPDQSQYTTLQPGMRVTSAYLPDSSGMFQATTAGVLVKDRIGGKFMTVAAHGFPGECGTDVNHALPTSGRKIGEVIYEVSRTDIGLVRLKSSEKFVNTTFESDYINNPVRLKRLTQANQLRKGDAIVLDSPDTGCIDGTFQAQAYQRVPTDDHSELEQQWVFTTWYYMGQDTGINLQAGMCGSAIWTEESDIVGFFRYAPAGGMMQDWCAATAADELINRGFTLVNTSDEEL